jgi:hypothetical protein
MVLKAMMQALIVVFASKRNSLYVYTRTSPDVGYVGVEADAEQIWAT